MSEAVSAQKVRALMHDINGALWVAIGTLDLTLGESGAEGCDPKCVQEALNSCLEVAALIGQLQQCLADLARVEAGLRSSDIERN
ncbi:MAG TPA: hypothetical protein VF193_12085 [Steroidobacter sp.]|jgi:hypothetical protein